MIQFVASARNRAKRKRLFEGHLSDQALKRATRDERLCEFAAETRTVTMLVCRIRGFSSLVECFGRDTESLTRFTRHATAAIARAVLEREGAIERIVPGEIGAIFNAPLDDPQHAVHACGAALAMLDGVEKANRALELIRRADGSHMPPLDIGIGINTGEAAVGNFGTENHPSYRAAGRAMRLAGEIENLTSGYGAAILVGEATRTLVERNFALLEVDRVALEASPAALPLFALLGSPVARANPRFIALKTFHDRIFEAYRARDWEAARGLIGQARALSGANAVLYDLYLSRIAHFEAHPPRETWSATFSQAAC